MTGVIELSKKIVAYTMLLGAKRLYGGVKMQCNVLSLCTGFLSNNGQKRVKKRKRW